MAARGCLGSSTRDSEPHPSSGGPGLLVGAAASAATASIAPADGAGEGAAGSLEPELPASEPPSLQNFT